MSKRKSISQREARALKRRVAELERLEQDRRNCWTRDWPGGATIATVTLGNREPASVAVATARRLGHYVVATADNDELRLYAVRVKA